MSGEKFPDTTTQHDCPGRCSACIEAAHLNEMGNWVDAQMQLQEELAVLKRSASQVLEQITIYTLRNTGTDDHTLLDVANRLRVLIQ